MPQTRRTRACRATMLSKSCSILSASMCRIWNRCKSFGIWSREFTQGYTPGMTGLDRWIAFDKSGFVGRDAAHRERDGGPRSRTLATLEVDALDADASAFAPIWRQGENVGFVTSGGYGYSLRKSLALALVKPEAARVGAELSVHVVGVERTARVIESSPYDPSGSTMRHERND